MRWIPYVTVLLSVFFLALSVFWVWDYGQNGANWHIVSEITIAMNLTFWPMNLYQGIRGCILVHKIRALEKRLLRAVGAVHA